MNLFRHFAREVFRAVETVAASGALPDGMDLKNVGVEPPRDPSHGDLATNAAMVLSKQARMKPRDIAEAIAPEIGKVAHVSGVEIAGPGFINIRLENSFWHEHLKLILREGPAYGNSDTGQGQPVNVEYVSANPTGPMHVGHARGAVFGDALAGLLAKVGWDVTREYYINDAGSQVKVLARSVHHRYREALGEDVGPLAEGLYPGDYLIPVAEALAERDGDKWRDQPEEAWLEEFRAFTIDRMMDMIRDDLSALGVNHDVFISEKALHDAGGVDAVVEELESRDLVYTGVLEPPKGKKPEDWESRPQLLFRATEWGDDTDRPLKKSDGSWTYFAADIANHLGKYKRGFNNMIDVFGADHGGYVKRMVSATRAVSDDNGGLAIKLCAMVKLVENGVEVKMSKRSGNFVTLRELVERVGKDVVRFILLTRKNEAEMDFDFKKVTEQSKDNPVFYVQYAHARCRSAFRRAPEEVSGLDVSADALQNADLGLLTHPAEQQLLREVATWPRVVEQAADAYEPHRLAFFLYDLAASFHGLYTLGNKDSGLRFIQADDAELTLARLAMVDAVRTVIHSGLDVLGVEPVEEMR